jgi:hypothetical protein
MHAAPYVLPTLLIMPARSWCRSMQTPTSPTTARQALRRAPTASSHGQGTNAAQNPMPQMCLCTLTCTYPATPWHTLQGALLCLAAVTVGLGSPSAAQLQVIVPCILRSFTDQDARVRYYALEALYNCAKVCHFFCRGCCNRCAVDHMLASC